MLVSAFDAEHARDAVKVVRQRHDPSGVHQLSLSVAVAVPLGGARAVQHRVVWAGSNTAVSLPTVLVAHPRAQTYSGSIGQNSLDLVRPHKACSWQCPAASPRMGCSTSAEHAQAEVTPARGEGAQREAGAVPQPVPEQPGPPVPPAQLGEVLEGAPHGQAVRLGEVHACSRSGCVRTSAQALRGTGLVVGGQALALGFGFWVLGLGFRV